MESAKRKRLAIGRERLNLWRRWVMEKVPKPLWAWWSWPRPEPIMIPLPKSKSTKTHDHPIKISTLTPKKPIKIKLVFQFSIFECTNKREIDRRTVEEMRSIAVIAGVDLDLDGFSSTPRPPRRSRGAVEWLVPTSNPLDQMLKEKSSMISGFRHWAFFSSGFHGGRERERERERRKRRKKIGGASQTAFFFFSFFFGS